MEIDVARFFNLPKNILNGRIREEVSRFQGFKGFKVSKVSWGLPWLSLDVEALKL
jgi:hypothetical protein